MFAAQAADARRRRIAQHLDQRSAAHAMQVAIQQLGHTPDFRRAASFAGRAAAVHVPLSFRQRQFRRLRPLLVTHLKNLLSKDISEETAAGGLRELVSAMGVAAYEADYIVSDAQRSNESPREPADYGVRLRNLQADHTQRIQAIQATPALDEELREQLVETEHERFRTQLLNERGTQR
jgi:hypothetical protein